MTVRMHRSPRLAAIALAATMALAGCSGEPTSAATDSGDPISTDVTITLTEFGIDMSRTDFIAGTEYTFTITNDGGAAHELMFIEPLDELEGDGMEDMEGHGGMDMDELDALAVEVISDEELVPGATVTRTITFPAGRTLEVACHLPGHYEAGMHTPIVVG